jgi:hypothetical protein
MQLHFHYYFAFYMFEYNDINLVFDITIINYINLLLLLMLNFLQIIIYLF